MNYYSQEYSVEIIKYVQPMKIINLSFCDDLDIDYNNIIQVRIENNTFYIGIERFSIVEVYLDIKYIIIYTKQSYFAISLADKIIYFDFLDKKINRIVITQGTPNIEFIDATTKFICEDSGVSFEEMQL